MSIDVPLSNQAIAELLARRMEETDGHRQRAYRRSMTSAFLWPEEASEVLAQGRPLTELRYVGDRLAARIEGWITDSPEVPEPPPSRRGFLTLSQVAPAAAAGAPQWRGQRGDLQMHTVYSDGAETVSTMAHECAKRGYEYIAITDHSGGQRIPVGMTDEEIEQQAQEIDAVNRESKEIRLLKSIEMNLRPDGSGALDATELKRFEIVVASFHSELRSTEDETHRYVAALRNPCVDIIGHPRARMFNRRGGLNADWDRVFDEAIANDKALEINSNPARQDLQLELLELAAEKGVRLSIGTDSHSIPELDWVVFSIGSAILAGVRREQIINYLSVQDLLEWRRAHGC